MLNTALKELRQRPDVEWVKVCVTSEDSSRTKLFVRSTIVFLGKVLFNPTLIDHFERPRFETLTSVGKRHDVEIIKPPDRNINDLEFVSLLKTKYAPTMALSIACLQIWRSELLGIFELAVNFHNGYLPDYKGLWATHWSVYNNEPHSGYAFHVMDEKIDTGPIILRGRVSIALGESRVRVERRKMIAAEKDLGRVVEAMISRRFELEKQSKGGSYYSGKRFRGIWTIDDPTTLTAEELFRRMHCFAPLKILIDGERYPMTSLRAVGAGTRSLSFKTVDGVTLAPRRIQYMPTRIYLAAKWFKESAMSYWHRT